MHASKTFMFIHVLLATLIMSTQTRKAVAASHALTAEEFMKVRCHPDGSPAYTEWTGSVTTSGVGAERARTLFKIVGFNVARCYRDAAGRWMVSSRELTYYLDPVSGEVLYTWKNPWTNESVPVVHIANDLVQQPIPAEMMIPVESLGATSIIRIDVPLSYPNPLAGDARFYEYSPESYYKAHESFSYVVATEDLQRINSIGTVDNVQVSWTRLSPWMPWMKMKGATGAVVFNALVRKVRNFSDLPELIRNEVSEHLPLYQDAPRCIVAGRTNVSSWTYFKDNFASYQAGLRFPRPAPLSLAEQECHSH
ncbi:MAG: DUF1838 domain-containing protein [Betaproteobacteria bacterium]|nr:DUF1838 domain-containing protein [Betaproteobacteria bacterium]